MQNKKNKKGGFTLIELLIVIAIIAILASVIFVSLNPLKRFRDARDSKRWSNISELMSAIKVDQIDNGGSYIAEIAGLTAGNIYMIGTDTTGCNGYTCDATVTSGTTCVDLTDLAGEGYIGSIPISPTGATTWTAGHTGYTLMASSSGILTLTACESEDTDSITLSR
jgi:prepilin-type N-terminal cleavage/methylation domain-containing protein